MELDCLGHEYQTGWSLFAIARGVATRDTVLKLDLPLERFSSSTQLIQLRRGRDIIRCHVLASAVAFSSDAVGRNPFLLSASRIVST
jgi:hypothetical protein